MPVSKDHLKVQIDGELLDACLVSETIPADEFGRAHKKHFYKISNGPNIGCYGWTKKEALQMLIEIANENGWLIFQKLN